MNDLASPPARGGTLARPGRFRRALARVGLVLGLSGVFAASTAAGVVLHLDTKPSRRIVRGVVNQVLANVFEGKIVADEIDHIGLNGADIRAARVIDPRGSTVIRASSIRARADVLDMVAGVVFGKGDLVIAIPDIRIEDADVVIEMGPERKVTLEETFTFREPAVPAAPSGKKGRAVRVLLSHIEIGHAWAHGAIAPPRSLDADVNRLVASVRAGPEGVAVDAQQTGLTDRSLLPAPVSGSADYHLRVRKEPHMWTNFVGQLGGVEVIARGRLAGSHLTARADIPQATPDQIATVLPGVPIREPVAAEITLEGDIPEFEVTTAISVQGRRSKQGEIKAEGVLDANGPVRVRLDLGASNVDPRIFGAALPEARVNADARLVATLTDGPPRLTVDAHSEAMQVEGKSVPPADVHLVLDRGLLSGTTHIYEVGMPVDGSFVVVPGDGVHFDARTEIANADAAPRIAGPVKGSARLRARGVVRRGQLDATVQGSVADVRTEGDVSLKNADVRGKVTGPVDDLRVDAVLTGTGVRAGGYDFETITAHAQGPALAPRLSTKLTDARSGEVDAEGQLDARAGAVQGVKVRIARDGDELQGTISRVGASRGGVVVEGVNLAGQGVGKVGGTLLVQGGDVTGSLRGDGVDLSRLAKLVGFPYRVRGIANVDVYLARGKAGRSGHVLVELENGEMPLVSGVSAQISARFKDDEVEADGLLRVVAKPATEQPGRASGDVTSADICDGTIAQLRFSKGTGKLQGPLLAAKTWKDLTGKVEVAAEDWNLHCIAKLVPVGLPVTDVRGSATTRFEIARTPAERFPSVRDLYFRTRGLEVSGPQGIHDNDPEWTSKSLDVQLKGSFDGATGKVATTLTLFDGQILADLTASADLDLPTLADQPARRWESLTSSNITAHLSAPRRPVGQFLTLPTFVHPYIPPMAGDVRIEGDVEGTIAAPKFKAHVSGYGLALADKLGAVTPSAWALPIDLDATATYDLFKGTLDAHVSKGSKEIITASGEVNADLRAILSTKPGEKVPWTGGFEAKLDDVPLGDVPLLADSGIAGHVGGTISVAHLNDKPTMNVELLTPDLKIGDDLFFEEGSIKVRTQRGDGPTDTAIASVKFVGQDGGRLDATGYSGIVWQDGAIPTLSFENAADLHARATRFRIAAFHPLVSSVLSKLDGYLDGELRVGWNRLAEGERGSIAANMTVSDGVFHVPQIGQEFKDAHVRITADPADKSAIRAVRFDDIRADGISGQIHGWALARMDGLRFLDAAGELAIDKGHELPITLEGVPLGNARGKFKLMAEKREHTVELHIGVTNLDLELPAAPGKGVQALDENPEVEVSHALGPVKEARSREALEWVFVFDLGDIHVTGTGIDTRLRGVRGAPPRVELTDNVRITGDIEIASGGKFYAFGKEFEIERGLVRMRAEDTSNPYLNVTAFWDSPDGARIYVDYVGVLKPITNEKLRFRSNPPRSQDEILASLLFGNDLTQDASKSQQGSPGQGLAAGVGGGVAAQQFNQILQGIGINGFTTRVGTGESGALKTSLVYEIGDTVTALASYEGSSQNGQNANTAAQGTSSQKSGRTEVSIDWRFHRNWSVRGTVGVGGDEPSSGVDLLWQYRY